MLQWVKAVKLVRVRSTKIELVGFNLLLIDVSLNRGKKGKLKENNSQFVAVYGSFTQNKDICVFCVDCFFFFDFR